MKDMKKVIGRPKYLKEVPNHYCPGCGHSTVHRLLAEVIEELKIRDRTICIPPCGCAVLAVVNATPLSSSTMACME